MKITNINSLNKFERKFFWLNNIAIALLMVGSVFVSMLNFLDTPYKLGIITGFCIIYAHFRKKLWNDLEVLEKDWECPRCAIKIL